MAEDWLADDADDADADDARARDMCAMAQRFITLGFKDGSAAGEEARLQEGFNEGFRSAAARGIAEGELLGIIRHACMHRSQPCASVVLLRPHCRARLCSWFKAFPPQCPTQRAA